MAPFDQGICLGQPMGADPQRKDPEENLEDGPGDPAG